MKLEFMRGHRDFCWKTDVCAQGKAFAGVRSWTAGDKEDEQMSGPVAPKDPEKTDLIFTL